MLEKMILGTAQFGQNYGDIIKKNELNLFEIEKILDLAEQYKINKIDTAFSYGNAEQKLGNFELKNWKIFSKIPKIPNKTDNISEWIDIHIENSLKNLKNNKIEGMLFHDFNSTLSLKDVISCEDIKKKFGLNYLGLSVYSPNDFIKIKTSLDLNLIQLPYNVFDRNIETYSNFLRKENVKIQVRSIFLQGLLLQNYSKLKDNFKKWETKFKIWFDWLKKNNLSNLEGCMSLINNSKNYDFFIVGVANYLELKQIIETTKLDLPKPPIGLTSDDINLIYPNNWKINE